jgi:hypothetical protein
MKKEHFIPVVFLSREREYSHFSGQRDDTGISMPEPSPMVFDQMPSTPPLLVVLHPHPYLRPADKNSDLNFKLKIEMRS